MNPLYLLSLTIYTFGVYASGTMLVYHLRARRMCFDRRESGPGSHQFRLGTTMFAVCGLWFLTALAISVGRYVDGGLTTALQAFHLMLAFLFPPLIMHSFHYDCGGPRRLPGAVWGLYRPLYVLAPAVGVYCLLGFFGHVPEPFGQPFGVVSGIGIGVFFAVAGVYSAAALHLTRDDRESRAARSSRRGNLVLLVVVVVLTSAFIVSEIVGEVDMGTAFRLVMSTMPLAFFFVGTWTENRFEFYDLFIKRGLSFLVTLVLLVAIYALTAPLLARMPATVVPWIHAIVLLPVALSLPWLHRRLGRVLDARWLGRSYGAGEAVRHVLDSIRRATTEAELVTAAEAALGRIFRAPARVVLEPGGTREIDIDARIDVPILLDGRPEGVVLLGPRESHAPYFSSDRVLLQSLAELLATMRDAVRQQRRRIEQERHARELSLQASRSELKALRAQINPHFLFNALNAIAGLIHRDPDRADATVERLSEVFRYTLRRSQTEWVVLEDELDFVQAYLDVERARFGARLTVGLHGDDDAAAVRIPAMIVQTLVENAVKHGVARVVGPARIEIAARVEDERLVVEVADSGPGFGPGDRAGDDERPAGTGFGLGSVRRRLAGHFGEAARLDIERDERAGLTRVRVTMPRGGPAAAESDSESDADSDSDSDGGVMAS